MLLITPYEQFRSNSCAFDFLKASSTPLLSASPRYSSGLNRKSLTLSKIIFDISYEEGFDERSIELLCIFDMFIFSL